MSRPQRKGRSVSLIKDKPKHKLVHLQIEFNELGQTIGNNRFEFTTYCGVTVRTRISILKQWNEVPQPEIDELWLNIKTHWNIPNDDYKAQVLKVCNQQWRSYKSKLVKFMDKHIDPLEKYPYLDKDMWNDFVKQKSKPEFKEIRVKATASVMMNKNPPRLGPQGYRGMRPRWEQEIESGVLTKAHQISSERARDYIFARLKRDSSGALVVTPDMEPLVDNIVEKEKQVSQGDLEIRPGSDLLVKVLGPEHPGRIRAIGYNVGLKQSILGIKEKNRKKHEILDLKEMKAKQEEHAKSIADMEDKIASLRREIAKNNDGTVTSPSPVVNKTSLESTPAVDALDKISVPTECELLLPYGMVQRRCAKGRVHPFGNGIVHSTPLQKDHVKVSVDIIYGDYHSLHIPVPTSDADNLGEALYSFIQWPRHAILLTKTSHSSPSVEKDASPPTKKVASVMDNQVQQYQKKQAAKRLPTIAKRATQNFVTPKKLQGRPVIQSWYNTFTSNKFVEDFHVESEPGMFGPGRIETYIRHDVILEMLNSEEIDITCILWYQIVLHSILATSGVNSRHWLLLVICPYQRTGYILDSIKKSGNPTDSYKVIKHVEKAVEMFNEDFETSHPMTWTIADCNQQLSNWECGYYVLKWMREFVMYRQYAFPNNLWNDLNPITEKLLDDVVNAWMTTFQSKYMK
ncbi:unnamed protein product [Lactuca saligna]|uniref:Ubiquitin-like protease family profile domain-containing protein n=1 Tax=Lactuca saligna TaxID=75948 RepID=A0AA36A466_LACSI|nr:unnamed protein product [Lactuca saligna]